MIDPVSLRVLLAVHDTGSVTRAARLLGYTAPNLTQHLRKLERSLKAPMVVRAGRGVVLTPEALAIIDQARAIIDGLDRLALTSHSEAAATGRFRIAAFPTALRGLVLPAMTRVGQSHPGLDLVPTELEPDPATELLRNGRLDAVVDKTFGPRTTAPPATGALTRIRLGIDPLDAVLPAGHRLAGARGLALAELSRERFAMTANEDPYGPWIASHSPDLLATVEGAYQAIEVASLLRFVELGLAVTILPRMGRPILPDGVVTVPVIDPDAFRTVELLVRPIAARSSVVVAVVDLLRAGLPHR